MSDPRRTIHFVFSSHWDREWYLPFQKFRAKLVRLLDTVLGHLESGRLPFYQMDGQFVPIEDYLKIRPEKEPQIRSLVSEGRLLVGPWYDLPDEFLVSGESLVRNFLLGMGRSEAMGQCSRAGWLCDIFGHNSQMPQILKQLGIANAFVWRGADLRLGPLFRWRGADGSDLLVHRLPENGYVDFAFDVRKISGSAEKPALDQMIENARAYFDKTVRLHSSRALLWFDGSDHVEFDPRMLELMNAVNRQLAEASIRVSTLDQYFEDLCSSLPERIPDWTGELREPCTMESLGWLIPGVGSSRVPLKQSNHACETLLTLWAEPWCAAAAAESGLEYPAKALELAWEYLLKNHPHDSICGCSTDETHASMPYRFDQCRQIAEVYLNEAFEAVAATALKGRVENGEMALSLFAPAGGAPQHCPEAFLRLPKDWPQFSEFFGFEPKPSMRLFGQDGAEIGYQIVEVVPETEHVRVPQYKFPLSEKRQGIRIVVDTDLEPAAGKHFHIRRAEGPTRLPRRDYLGVSRNSLRNGFLEVSAEDNGTITVVDLESGHRFAGLLALEDTADIGDGWFHGTALCEKGYLSTGGQVSLGLAENGPLLASLHIRVEWKIPAEFDFKTNRRSDRLVSLVAEHRITLRKRQRHLEIDTTIHNNARDHRVRLLCPTGFSGASSYWSDTPFDAVERPVSFRADNHLDRELQVEMTPQQNWVAAAGGGNGLALLAPGQYESAMLDQPDRPLCVTLLRAFRRAVFTDGNEGGQIQGTHRFRLGLFPFREDLPAAELCRIAQSLAAPARCLYWDAPEIGERASAHPAQIVKPQIAGDLVVSACYQSAPGRWTFRLFNPSSEDRVACISGGRDWTSVDLRGGNGSSVKGGELVVGPKKVVTLQVTL